MTNSKIDFVGALGTGLFIDGGCGDEILLGDVLISKCTHDVVVQWHSEKKIYIVKVVNEDIWFPLDEFVNAWGRRLEVKDSIIMYQYNSGN